MQKKDLIKTDNIRLKTLKNINLENKTILLRTDYNVPILNGIIVNDFRIKQSLETINYLLNHKVKRIIILSHYKNPEGYDEKYSLKPMRDRLEKILGQKIELLNLEQMIEIKNKITMIENIRFWKEKENSPALAEYLAKFADIYVFDAFSVSHRKHTTTYELMKHMDSYAGLLMEKEVKNLLKIFDAEKPFIAIIGGAKISTKLNTIYSLTKRCNNIFLGGAMIFTLMKAINKPIGKSLHEDDMINKLKIEWNNNPNLKEKIVLPNDFIVSYNEESKPRITKTIKENEIGYDIGPESIKRLKQIIDSAKTIVWNGPMGLFENEKYQTGTKAVVKLLEKSSAFTIIGGGETVEAIEKWSNFENFNHISTGGGAMLKFIENPLLPAIEGLLKK